MEIAPEVIDIGNLRSNDNIMELKKSQSFDDDDDDDFVDTTRKPSVNFGSGI